MGSVTMRSMKLSLLAIGSSLLLAGCAGYVSVSSQPEPAPEPPPAADRPEPAPPANSAHIGIPPGHLPPVGQCRIWYPGRPPGHQPRADRCDHLERQVPAGAWLVYRIGPDKRDIRVYAHDPSGELVSVYGPN